MKIAHIAGSQVQPTPKKVTDYLRRKNLNLLKKQILIKHNEKIMQQEGR